jgi:hypothetical protein
MTNLLPYTESVSNSQVFQQSIQKEYITIFLVLPICHEL